MNEHEEVPRRALCDGRWCSKSGVIIVNGRCTDVPVWVSADGTLVLPAAPYHGIKAGIGSRIRMLRRLWLVCHQGDLGTITGLRESGEDSPRSWFVTMDDGSQSCVFEGEFEMVREQEPERPEEEVSIGVGVSRL